MASCQSYAICGTIIPPEPAYAARKAADVGFFLQTYSHVLGSDDREAADQAAAFLIGDAWETHGEDDSSDG